MINENKIRQIYKSNREQGFRLLVEYFQEPIYYYIRRLVVLHEDAEDVLQEVFIQIYRHWDQFRNESSLSTWSYRIATNEAINFLNEKRRKVFGNSSEITDVLENTLESDPWFCGDEIQAELQRAILKLTDRQRLIFNMKYFDDMTYEDIAEVLDVAVGTLKATYHNAVKKIEESMRIADNCF